MNSHSSDPSTSFTLLLQKSRDGEQAALDQLLPYVYDELRGLARRKLGSGQDAQTLQPTALVNEVYLRLVDQKMAGLEDRSHFLQLCARVMRHILVDRARARQAVKRDAGKRAELPLTLQADSETESDALDVLALDEALERLIQLDTRKARVVELRYFSGLNMDEVAAALHVSKRTVEADWTFARAWLRREMDR
ncbi:MAG: ECF-type sigma factor [Planctomycetota bacterium]|nr:ECF-type sigma factor [Planctomycetota bacterium]